MAEQGEPIKVGVREFRGRMSEYLKQARDGARFVVMSRGEPLAEIGAPDAFFDAPQTPRARDFLSKILSH